MTQNYVNPSIATHVAETAELPPEPAELLVGRPDLPTPSLWQAAVKVTHKVTKKPAVVIRVDYGTNIFRAFFPDEGPLDENGKPKGRHCERTEWFQCKDWDVDVTFSPAELERQAARAAFEMALKKLDAEDLAAVEVFCDDADPKKNLGKLKALHKIGAIKIDPTVAAQAIEEKKAKK